MPGRIPDTGDRPGPKCREVVEGAVSATRQRDFSAAVSRARSSWPSSNRKRPPAVRRVVQRIRGAFGCEGERLEPHVGPLRGEAPVRGARHRAPGDIDLGAAPTSTRVSNRSTTRGAPRASASPPLRQGVFERSGPGAVMPDGSGQSRRASGRVENRAPWGERIDMAAGRAARRAPCGLRRRDCVSARCHPCARGSCRR